MAGLDPDGVEAAQEASRSDERGVEAAGKASARDEVEGR